MSDTAKKCPHCGYKQKKLNKNLIFGIILIILGIGALIISEFQLTMSRSYGCYKYEDEHFITAIILYILMLGLGGWSVKIFSNNRLIRNILIGLLSLSILVLIYQFTIDSRLASDDEIREIWHQDIQQNSLNKYTDNNLKNVKSVNEFEELIDGTTWHFTQNLDKTEIPCWIMVTFDNGKYKTYYANPSDGYWTEGGNGEYKVEESRYSNTGEKYYVISWEGQMQLKKGIDISGTFALTQNGEFYIQPFVGPVVSGIMEYGNYEWK